MVAGKYIVVLFVYCIFLKIPSVQFYKPAVLTYKSLWNIF